MTPWRTTARLLGMALLLVCIKSRAEVTLPKILGNNMLLQQQQAVTIWGNASPGEKVTVSFGKQSRSAVTGPAGKWLVLLGPLTASATPATMTIAGRNTIRLENVLVGEVWLCSGQSNMEYTMRKNSKVVKPDSTAKDSPVDELQRASNPAMRIFLVTSKNLQKPDSTHSGWSIARDSALRSFSAPAYFFAKELYARLHVPIGMISSAIPGSAIEPWLPGTIPAALKDAAEPVHLKLDESMPGKFFPTMIRPLAPFAIKGFLWYQGETNCFQNETTGYTYKMEALINGWRKLWNSRDLPFYYVQIAPFYYSKNAGKFPLTTETLPRFWEAQALAMQIPNTGMIVTTDLINTPDDLHPGYKWEIGRRLAQWALARDYQLPVVPSGPLFRQKKVVQDKVILQFDHTGSGLVSKDGKPLTQFEVAGADGQFVPAQAVIEGHTVVVSATAVPHPVEVRFGWNEGGKANLYNKEGLPAMPFRTANMVNGQW